MKYDLIVIGSGAAGVMASSVAAADGKKVLLLEKLPKIALKLKATGGGKCNITNTLSSEEFMEKFAQNGRFMSDALKEFSQKELLNFLKKIGVDTHAPDGFRVFPTSHSSNTIVMAFEKELATLGVRTICKQRVKKIIANNNQALGVQTDTDTFYSKNIVIATGGLGYPTLGGEGDGYELAKKLGHTITELHPAMLPLKTKEKWVRNCTADTIPKVELTIAAKKYKKFKASGDLIFTKHGIRGPVVLDFAREITPLLKKNNEVAIVAKLTKLNEEQIASHLHKLALQSPLKTTLELVETLLPRSVAKELSSTCDINETQTYSQTNKKTKAKLASILANTPLTITGHDGFKAAMVTRGGVNLKEVNPKTMQSKKIQGVYFCGEVLNLDGPCGGYNLQWSFSSGYLAGKLYS